MQPYQSPPVTGGKNYTPEQMIAQGTATANAGGALLDLSAKMDMDAARAAKITAAMNAKIQDTMDENAAKAADSAFMSEASQLLHGKGGYFSTKGRDAESQYKATEQALIAAGSKQQALLTTDAQRTMYMSSVARTTTSFLSQMGDHWNRENAVYSAGEANARGEQYANAAVNNYQDSFKVDGQYNANLITARNELTYGLSQIGVYEGSAQHRQSMSKLNSTVARGVVNRFMNDKRFADGIAYVESLTGANGIDAATSTLLMDSLKTNREVQMDQELAYSIQTHGTFTTPSGSGNFMNPVNGGEVVGMDDELGLSLSVAAGTSVRAPANALITKSEDDTVVLQTRNGTVITFHGVDNTTLKEGDIVGRGDTLGIPSKANKGMAQFSYSVDRNGNRIASDGMNEFISSEPSTLPPSTEREALKLADRIGDLQQRRRVKSLIRADWSERDSLDEREEQTRWRSVLELVANEGAPSPEQLSSLSAVHRKQYIDSRDSDRNEQMNAEAQLQMAREGGASLETLDKYGIFLSRSALTAAFNDVNSASASEARFDQDELTKLLQEAGLENLTRAKVGSEDAATELKLRLAIKNQIRQQQINLGRGLNYDEKRDVMRSFVVGEVVVKGWMFDSAPTLLMDVKPKDRAKTVVRLKSGAEITLEMWDAMRATIEATIQADIEAGKQTAQFAPYVTDALILDAFEQAEASSGSRQ
jgi:hypothetical protein